MVRLSGEIWSQFTWCGSETETVGIAAREESSFRACYFMAQRLKRENGGTAILLLGFIFRA